MQTFAHLHTCEFGNDIIRGKYAIYTPIFAKYATHALIAYNWYP